MNSIRTPRSHVQHYSSKFEGYTVAIQWDQARPHTDKVLVGWAKAECARRGWLWEPQSPQLPISNVQDVLVFPLMARRNSELCLLQWRGISMPLEASKEMTSSCSILMQGSWGPGVP